MSEKLDEIGVTPLGAGNVRGQIDCAVAVLDRAVDDTSEYCVNGTPNGDGRVLLGGGKWAVMIEEILPQADEKTAKLERQEWKWMTSAKH